MIRPQIIEREGKPEYAVIPIAEWRRIEALLEELEEIRDLDAALAQPDRRMIPFEGDLGDPGRGEPDPRLARAPGPQPE